MPYLSQVLNIRVEDSADKVIGKLQDILIAPKPGIYDSLELVLIKNKKKEFCVPYSAIDTFSTKEVSLKTLFDKTEILPVPENHYTWLKRDVLDQQIVDVEDARVVRVNDLRLGKVKGEMKVLAIGVGFKSLLRRLGMDKLDVFNFFKVNLVEWRKTQLVKNGLQIDTLSKEMKTLHPADLANIIEDLTVAQGEELVSSLDDKSAAEVVEELDPELQKILVDHLGPEKASNILKKMSIDEIVDLMQMLPKSEVGEYLSYLESKKQDEVEELIRYDDDSAGGLMTTDYVAVAPEQTVRDVIDVIEKVSASMRFILYVYVVDENKKLLGAVSMRKLLLEKEDAKMKDIHKPLSSISVLDIDDKLDDIVELMTKYNLFTAAVISQSGKMKGLVSIDDVMRELKPNA